MNKSCALPLSGLRGTLVGDSLCGSLALFTSTSSVSFMVNSGLMSSEGSRASSWRFVPVRGFGLMHDGRHQWKHMWQDSKGNIVSQRLEEWVKYTFVNESLKKKKNFNWLKTILNLKLMSLISSFKQCTSSLVTERSIVSIVKLLWMFQQFDQWFNIQATTPDQALCLADCLSTATAWKLQ